MCDKKVLACVLLVYATRGQLAEHPRLLHATPCERKVIAARRAAAAIPFNESELAVLEATFRTCNICAGHFTGEEDRRGPPPEVPEKNSLQRDIEKLAYFAANEIQPTLRQALSTAVTSAYSTTHVQHNVVSKSIMQALESQEQTGFYSTKLRALAEIPAHLHVEVTMKKAKARSEMIVNMKRELIAYETAKGTSRTADLSELEIIRREVHQKVMKAKVGRAITGDRPMQKQRKVARQMTEQAFNAAAFARALRNRAGDRVTARDVQEAMKQLRKK